MSSSMTVQEFISGSLDLELTGMEFVDDVLLPHLEGGGYLRGLLHPPARVRSTHCSCALLHAVHAVHAV